MTAGLRAQADEDVELRRLARLTSGGRARPASSARRAAQGGAAADFDSFVYTRRRCACRVRLVRGEGRGVSTQYEGVRARARAALAGGRTAVSGVSEGWPAVSAGGL
jgi:hypothetical protein